MIPDYTDPQSLNRYSYVQNNPLMYVDPTGHVSFSFDLNGKSWGWDSDGLSNSNFQYFLDRAEYNFTAATLMATVCPVDGFIGEAVFGTLAFAAWGTNTLLYSNTKKTDIGIKFIQDTSKIPPGTPLGPFRHIVNEGISTFIKSVTDEIKLLNDKK